MTYCTTCGTPFKEGANFCSNCGSSIELKKEEPHRNTHFDGELFKCPSCGALWNTLGTVCQSCGYERRGAKAVASAREFNAEIQKIASNPYYTEEERLSKIKDKIVYYPIPNTKEDLFEFISMARIRKEKEYYGTIFTEGEQEIAGAWAAKYEELYFKAKISYPDSTEFLALEKFYQKDHKNGFIGKIARLLKRR